MKYSQVITYYKQPDILRKTLYIWANQKFNPKDYEVIVVDGENGSAGILVAKEIKKQFPLFNLRYFVFNGKNIYKNQVHAYNVGVQAAHGEIIGLTMEDRLTTFDAVEALYSPHSKHQNIFCTVLPYLMEGTVEQNPFTKEILKNPKLLFSIANPTAIAKKEIKENESTLCSIPKKVYLELGGIDERWRNYSYYLLDFYARMLQYGLKSFEVSWILNVHHHHLRHGTMDAALFDRQARVAQWDKIRLLNQHGYVANLKQKWGINQYDKEIIL